MSKIKSYRTKGIKVYLNTWHMSNSRNIPFLKKMYMYTLSQKNVYV